MGTVQALVCSFVVISTFRLSSLIRAETVEEGKPVTLKCTDLVVSRTNFSEFFWYKVNQSYVDKIASYFNYDGVQKSLGDFAKRATIDGTTGALTILSTKVSDDHFYSCLLNTATGHIWNKTQLIITVTPSQQDLKITTSPTGPVKVGETVSFNCSASRVKPPPKHMYWQFTDDANQINKTYRNDANADNLTSSVSLNYSMVVDQKDNGRKLICHYVTETGSDIKSEEATVKVLIYKPSGKPQIILRDRKVKVDSAISLTCDIEEVDGVIVWFKWQFVNGTELVKTTEMTWTYRTRGNAETLQFVCIAGNAVGQSRASAPIEVKIQRFESDTKIPLILGIIIGLMTIVIIAMAVYIICIKLQTNKLKTQNNERAPENGGEVSGKPNEDYEYMDPPDQPHTPGNQLPPDYINLPAEMPYEPLRK